MQKLSKTLLYLGMGLSTPGVALSNSYTSQGPVGHIQLKNSNGDIQCSAGIGHNESMRVLTAADCPSDVDLTVQLFTDRWSQNGITPNNIPIRFDSSATYSYTSGVSAAHMQLKSSPSDIECSAGITQGESMRQLIATGCPGGVDLTVQLFDENWSQSTITPNNIMINLSEDTTGGSGDSGNIDNGGGMTTSNEGLPRNNNPRFTRRFYDPFNEDNNPRGPNGISFDPTQLASDDGDLTVYLADSADIRDPAYNTTEGNGNFRITCQWSHFAYDDPIVRPDVTGGSHLHMYFGKTNADASTYNADDVIRDGGGTCNGFAVNRSAYWTPALMSDMNTAVVPEEIIVYYKTTLLCPSNSTSIGRNENGYRCRDNDTGNIVEPVFDPDDTYKLPQGLRLIAGNPQADTLDISQGDPEGLDEAIHWSCGKNGHTFVEHYQGASWEETDAQGFAGSFNNDGEWVRKTRKILFDRIPTRENCRYDTEGSNGLNKNPNRDDDSHPERSELFAPLAANIYFPQCLNDRNVTFTVPGSEDLMAHVSRQPDWKACGSEPESSFGANGERMPRLGFLIYWDLNNSDESNISDWFLSSDMEMIESNGEVQHVRRATPAGSSLHADWLGGWHEDVQETWLEECLRTGNNCATGQTGTHHALGNLVDDAATPSSNAQTRGLIYQGHEVANYGHQAGSFFVRIPAASMNMGDGESGNDDTTNDDNAPPPPPPPAPSEIELVTTGGFEADSLAGTGWIRVGNVSTTSIEWQGREHGQVFARSGKSVGRTKRWNGFKQFLPLDNIQRGTPISLSAYIKLVEGSATDTARLRVRTKSDGVWSRTHQVIRLPVNGWSWTKLEGVWDATWDGENLTHVEFRIDGPNNGVGFLVDDASAVITQ